MNTDGEVSLRSRVGESQNVWRSRSFLKQAFGSLATVLLLAACSSRETAKKDSAAEPTALQKEQNEVKKAEQAQAISAEKSKAEFLEKSQEVVRLLKDIHKSIAVGVNYQEFSKKIGELEYEFTEWQKTPIAGRYPDTLAAVEIAVLTGRSAQQHWKMKIEIGGGITRPEESTMEIFFRRHPDMKKDIAEGGVVEKTTNTIVWDSVIQVFLSDTSTEVGKALELVASPK